MKKKHFKYNNIPDPFFSVIIPTYNRLLFVEEAIKSVLSQTLQDFEILVIDDGSTDKTREVITCIADHRLRYFYKQNEERSIARNYGINKSKGRYICFLDSDDIFLSNHLEVLFREIQSNNFLEGLYHTKIFKNLNETELIEDWFIGKENKEIVQSIIRGSVLYMNGICVSTTIIKENKFPVHFNYWEDQHLWIRILVQYPFFGIDQITSQWNIDLNSSTSSIFEARSIKNLDKYLGCIDDVANSPEVKKSKWLNKNEFNKLKLKKANDFVSTNSNLNFNSLKQFFVCLKYLNIFEVTKMYFHIFVK